MPQDTQHERQVSISFNSTAEIEELRAEVARLKRAIVLLAHHVGGIGWDPDLRKIVDEFRDEIRS